MAVASKPMAMQPTIARQNGRASSYIVRCLPPHLRFLRRKQPSMQLLAWPGTVLIPISQGTEVMIVTEYVLFSIFRMCVWTSLITPCYDVERLETKTHIGLGPGEPIEYTKHRVWALRVISGQTKQKMGLNNVGQVNPKDCNLSRKNSGLQGGDIQVVKPYKCGRRRPASRLTNVWNGHPAGPCPRRGDTSGGMGSDSDGALQPRGGVC